MNPVMGLSLGIGIFAFVTFLPRLQVRSRRLFLLRVLFPSWRFFESIGVVPQLEVRVSSDGVEWTEWVRVLVPPIRGWSSLVFNPDGNLHFARQSAVEHLVSEVESWIEASEARGQGISLDELAVRASQTTAYAVVQAIAGEAAHRRGGFMPGSPASAGSARFQFRIQSRDDTGALEEFLTSSVHAFSGVGRSA